MKIKLKSFFKKIPIVLWKLSEVPAKIVDIKELFPLDTRDFCVFGGLGVATYGLYLFEPWLAFSVVGFILTGIGLFFGGRRKK